MGRPRFCLIDKQDSHNTYSCFKLESMTKEDLEEKNICPRCLNRSDSVWHENTGCSKNAKRFICNVHKLHFKVCRCEMPPTTTQSCAVRIPAQRVHKNPHKKTDFSDKKVFFYSEIAHLKDKDGKFIPVVVNYDSHASDSTVHGSLAEHLRDVHDEGSIVIQQYGTNLKQKNAITGLIKLEELDEDVRLLVNDNPPAEMIKNEAVLPKLWQQKHGVEKKFISSSGKVMIMLGQDMAHLFPVQVDNQGKLVLAKSCLTSNFLIGGNYEEKVLTDEEENEDSTMEQLETEEVQEAEQADNKEPAIRPIKRDKDDAKKTAHGHCTKVRKRIKKWKKTREDIVENPEI